MEWITFKASKDILGIMSQISNDNDLVTHISWPFSERPIAAQILENIIQFSSFKNSERMAKAGDSSRKNILKRKILRRKIIFLWSGISDEEKFMYN